MKKQFFIMLAIVAIFGYQSVSAQGLILNDDYKKAFSSYEPEDLGFSEELPSKASLRKFAPTPRNQQGSTCVGWAGAYAAMSIQFNYTYNITDKNEKDAFAFDPYFLFHQIKGENNFNCENGTSMLDALIAMRDYGVKRQLLPAHLICENDMATALYNKSLEYAKSFRIKDALIFDLEGAETKETMKYALTQGFPIMIGTNIATEMEVDSREKYGTGVGLWEPNASYKEKLGGHAMCIVGYDDTKFGGAWEIQNSWGTEIGDNGYIWVKYSDFNQIAVAAVIMEFYDYNTSAPACQFGDCENSYSRADFGTGEKYEGEVKNGNFDGWGYEILKDKSIYAGPYTAGKKNGKGFYLTADHTWFIVQMENGALVDSESLGFSTKTAEKDAIIDASASVLSNYIQFDEGMPNAKALETGGKTSFKKKK
jgi:hypothetical protein